MKNQYIGSQHVIVSRGYDPMPYINGSAGLGTGQVRYNPQTKNLEVYDGMVWQELRGPDVNLTLSNNTEHILTWAEKKMQEEKDFQRLAEKYPALADAKEKLDIILALIKDEQK
jgi:hypothetical protein